MNRSTQEKIQKHCKHAIFIRRHANDSRHTEICLISPMIREMQSKPIGGYFSFIRLAIIKKAQAYRIAFKLCSGCINRYSLRTILRYLAF